MTDRRSRRADARRNYERLVEQARIAFAEFGVDASLDEIARRAGVASGTLYRHFPTRLDLVEVVLAEQLAGLVTLGRDLLATDETDAQGVALATWSRAALTHALTYRGLAAAVMNSDRDAASGWHAELFEVGSALVARARASGAIVADVAGDDVVKLVGAVAWAVRDAEDGAARADRLLAVVLNGLRRE